MPLKIYLRKESKNMNYKFCKIENYEDFACGRVIYNKAGYPNYPVRLSLEIFMRCLEYIGGLDKEICLYDPCCGSGYMLTVLGFLCNKNIKSIYASDISKEACIISRKNLNLLKDEGLRERREELIDMYNKFNKDSHKEALLSIDNISNIKRKKSLNSTVFRADILDTNSLLDMKFKVDVVMTDVPYGKLVSWSSNNDNAVDTLLDTLIPVLNKNSIIAISCDKKQKMHNEKFIKLDKFQIGKRKIYLLKR